MVATCYDSARGSPSLTLPHVVGEGIYAPCLDRNLSAMLDGRLYAEPGWAFIRRTWMGVYTPDLDGRLYAGPGWKFKYHAWRGIYTPFLDGSSCILSEKEFILPLTHGAEYLAPSPVLRGRAGEGELPSPLQSLLTTALLNQSLQHLSTSAPQHYSTTAPQHYSTTALQHYSTTALQHYSTSIPYFLKPSSSSKSLLFLLSAHSDMLRFLERLWPEQE